MQVSRFGMLAALAVSATLPLAGPVHAEAESASLDVAAPLAAVAAVTDPAPAMVSRPVVQALPVQAQSAQSEDIADETFESIGSGVASYYGVKFAGRRTASGAIFDPEELTAAHRTLPFGTQVQVTNPRNGESVIVTITDRGPYHGNRVIDLSKAAARELGLVARGSGKVDLAVLSSAG